MNTTQLTTPVTRRERRQSSKELTVSTWHNGTFGVWPWSELTPEEQQAHMEAQKRNQYVSLFGIYS